MKSLKKKLTAVGCTLGTSLLVLANNVYAAPGPGEKFGTWLQTQAQGIFIGVVAVVGIILFLTRKTMAAVTALLFAGIAAWLIYSPDSVAQTIKNLITQFF